MKKILPVLFLLFIGGVSRAQINNPVTWAYTAKKIAAKTYELHLTATVSGNWHIYSQNAGDGPVPTTFTFSPNQLVTLNGKVKEVGKLEKSYDPNFKSTLQYYSQKVDFVQVVKIKAPVATVVAGTINYIVCNDRTCLPPKDVAFSINVSGK